MESSCSSGRRLFLKFFSLFGITAGNLTLLQMFFSGCESDTKKTSNNNSLDFDITNEPSLSTDGGAAKKVFGDLNSGKPVLMIRKDSDTFIVLTTVCTHLGCEVELPDKVSGIITCPCHGSQYSAEDGLVLQGPAETPLTLYTSSFNSSKNILTIYF